MAQLPHTPPRMASGSQEKEWLCYRLKTLRQRDPLDLWCHSLWVPTTNMAGLGS
jgi:hypothetical protein